MIDRYRTLAALLFAPVVLAACLLGALPDQASGQSLLDRTPNVGNGWSGTPGTLQFHFLHRFNRVDTGDESTTLNSPTFLLAYPLPGRTVAGVQYATESLVIPGSENEWELFGRWIPLSSEDGSPLDLAVTGAYNTAASSVDGELLAALPMGRLRILGVARFFSDQAGRDESGIAAGGGAVVRITDNVALAGDLVSAFDRPDDRRVAWGAGVQIRIPTTPHTLSLQATNTRTATLIGSSEGFEESGDGGDRVTWGFEFTIPITPSRFF